MPIGPYRTVLCSTGYRMIRCPQCKGFRVEDLDVFDAGGPRVTRRFARYIYELCQLMTVQEVADHLGLNWKTVKAIDKQGLLDAFSETDYTGLRYLAVDEIAYKKHHYYLTVVIDFETGRVVWVGKDRRAETLDAFFSGMPEPLREKIEAVAMDMWDPYRIAVEKWCPQAAVVFDPFHVIKKYSEVIDEVRREEVRKASSDDGKKVLKGSRWLLLKNRDHLSERQQPHLNELLAANENLYKVYVLKEDLKAAWSYEDRKKMAGALYDWCTRAQEADLEPLNRFVKLLADHADGILNHATHAIHNGRLEGINNKIKVLKREAYGFHDLEYFCLKIKQRCPGHT